MKVGDSVTVAACRPQAPAAGNARVTHITPTGRLTVVLPDGRVLKFDSMGFQLGREYPDYALVGFPLAGDASC